MNVPYCLLFTKDYVVSYAPSIHLFVSARYPSIFCLCARECVTKTRIKMFVFNIVPVSLALMGIVGVAITTNGLSNGTCMSGCQPGNLTFEVFVRT